MPSKTIGAVRILGGDEFWYKLPSGQWTSLGYVAEGYFFGDTEDIEKIPLAGGFTKKESTGRSVRVELEMGQTDKSALELKQTLHRKLGEFYMYDGEVNAKYLELYGKVGQFFVTIEKKEADKPQKIKITVEFEKQSTQVTVADTGLPSVKKCAVGSYSGVDYYVVWIETAIT